jgi:hypothetical protein
MCDRVLNHTGITVSIYDTEHPDNHEYTEPSNGRWAVRCENHGIHQRFKEHFDAVKAMEKPSTFCAGCAHLVRSSVPEPTSDSEGPAYSRSLEKTSPKLASAASEIDSSYKDLVNCDNCGRYPAIRITVRQARGWLFFRTLRSSSPIALCRECGLAAFKGKQLTSASSLLFVNPFSPYAMAQNQKWIMRLKRLPDPE